MHRDDLRDSFSGDGKGTSSRQRHQSRAAFHDERRKKLSRHSVELLRGQVSAREESIVQFVRIARLGTRLHLHLLDRRRVELSEVAPCGWFTCAPGLDRMRPPLLE